MKKSQPVINVMVSDAAAASTVEDAPEIAVSVCVGNDTIPVEHLSMAAWLVRKTGSVDAALRAVTALRTRVPKTKE